MHRRALSSVLIVPSRSHTRVRSLQTSAPILIQVFRAHSNCLSLTSTRTFRPSNFLHPPAQFCTAPPCGRRPVAQPFPQIWTIWVSRIKYKSTNSREKTLSGNIRSIFHGMRGVTQGRTAAVKYQKHGEVLNKEVVSVESAGCSHTLALSLTHTHTSN